MHLPKKKNKSKSKCLFIFNVLGGPARNKATRSIINSRA